MKYFLMFILSLNVAFGLQIQSIKADFVSLLENDDFSAEYRGFMVASIDSKAYWRYDIPIQKEIFVNNNAAIIYEPKLAQAIVHRQLDINFVKIINSAKQSGDVFVSVVNDIVFNVWLKDGKPHKVRYKDELDNEITITLFNVVLDEKIDDEIFIFKIPENIDIINY